MVRSDAPVLGVHTLTGGVDAVYTVPADRTLIVKDVRFNRSSGAGAVIFCFALSGADAVLGTLCALTFDANGFASLTPSPWAVLREGQKLALFGTAGNAVRTWISGALLDGDPA